MPTHTRTHTYARTHRHTRIHTRTHTHRCAHARSHPPRQVSCFPDKTGYLVGSIEGRVAVHHVEDSVGQQKNFTFKCHRLAGAPGSMA